MLIKSAYLFKDMNRNGGNVVTKKEEKQNQNLVMNIPSCNYLKWP